MGSLKTMMRVPKFSRVRDHCELIHILWEWLVAGKFINFANFSPNFVYTFYYCVGNYVFYELCTVFRWTVPWIVPNFCFFSHFLYSMGGGGEDGKPNVRIWEHLGFWLNGAILKPCLFWPDSSIEWLLYVRNFSGFSD